jgi:hypothetical protein
VVDDRRWRRTDVRKRASTTARRVGLHAMAYLRPAAPPTRPVFIIGCPRSGTTLLSALLRRHPDLGGSAVEGHVLWNAHHRPSQHGWGSDCIAVNEIAPDERRFLNAAIHRASGGRRFIDKTPKNALRVPYLDALFPDASYVFITRDGRANVASLIEGWTLRHGMSWRVPETLDIGVYRGRYWCYILPPGWRDVARSPVEEVAAFQYVTTNEIAMDDLARIPADRVTKVAFEDLLADPVDVAAGILDAVGLSPSEAVARFSAKIDEHQVSANSPPRPDKWRDRQEQIDRILPTIAPTMRRLGYTVEEVER